MAGGPSNIHFANENRGSQIGVFQGTQHNHYSSHGPQQAQSTPDRLWMVPRSVSTLFTGRDETLKRLRDALLPSEHGDQQAGEQRRYVLCGLGGVGKSEVCLKFANSVRNKFWAVLWVDVSSPTIAESRFTEIAKRCGASKHDMEGAIEWLANTEKEWLLILDNADDPHVDYADYFPSGDSGAILITTRNPACDIHQTAGYESLDVLEKEASITLLLKAVGIPETSKPSFEEAARAVAELLGSHTLAIMQAGAYVKNGYCQLEEYPKVFTSQRNRLLRFRSKQAKSSYGDVYATFEVSAQALLQKPGASRSLEPFQEPGAADALALLSVLASMHHETVPIEMFERAWKQAKRISDNASWEPDEGIRNDRVPSEEYLDDLSIWHVSKLNNILPISPQEWDDFALRRALNLLASFSIIRVESTAGSATISMHPVAHAWATDRMTPEQHKHAWETTTAILGLSLDIYRFQSIWRPLQPHIHFYLDHKLTKRVAKQPAFHLAQTLYRCGFLLNTLHDNTKVLTALDMLRKMETGCSMTLYDSILLDQLTADSYLTLGRCKDAVLLLEKAVQSASRSLDAYEGFLEELQQLLAAAYNANGQNKQAVEILEQLVAIRCEKLGAESPECMDSEHELAVAYHDMGQNEQAVEILEHVVNVRKKTLEAVHQFRLASEHELARAYLNSGQSKQAAEILEHVVNVRRMILGAEHPELLASEHELARTYLALGKEDDIVRAVELLERVFAIQKRTLEAEDPSRLVSQHELARAYLALGKEEDIKQAVELLEQVVAISSRTLEAENPSRLVSQHVLATAHLASGNEERVERAVELLEHVVTIRKRVLDAADPERLASEEWLEEAKRRQAALTRNDGAA